MITFPFLIAHICDGFVVDSFHFPLEKCLPLPLTEVDPLLTRQSVPAASVMKAAKQKINLIQKDSLSAEGPVLVYAAYIGVLLSGKRDK